MKLMKRLLVGLAGLLIALVVIGFLLPSSARVERSIVIDRPASLIFPLLNSYQRFNDWSPWHGIDPNTEYTYGEIASGVGATMTWKGNETVGSGKQTITASEPDSRVASELEFGDAGISQVEMRLTAEGRSTRVTWSFQADIGNDLIGRYFGLLMDRFVGPDYEKGLTRLKALVETFPDIDIAGIDIQLVDVSAKPILYVTASSTQDISAISRAYTDAYSLIAPALEAAKLSPAGPLMGIDNYWDDRGYGFDAAIPVERTDLDVKAPVQAGQTYAGRAVRVHYIGPYSGLVEAQRKGAAFALVHGLKQHDRVYTEFVSDPDTTPEAELISDTYLPVE